MIWYAFNCSSASYVTFWYCNSNNILAKVVSSSDNEYFYQIIQGLIYLLVSSAMSFFGGEWNKGLVSRTLVTKEITLHTDIFDLKYRAPPWSPWQILISSRTDVKVTSMPNRRGVTPFIFTIRNYAGQIRRTDMYICNLSTIDGER